MTITPLPLPTQDSLPCDDGVPTETQRHKMQMDLLMDALYPWLDKRDNGYVGGQEAQQAQAKNSKLAAKLREMGIDPDTL